MFKFKKELSLKEAEHIAKSSIDHILDGYIVCIRRKTWVDNLFVIYIASLFYVDYKPVLVMADAWGYRIPYGRFYRYTQEEGDASDWELVKMDADEYREIRVDFELIGVGNIPYNITTEVNRLSNFIGVSYPTNTGILYTCDSNLESRQDTKNHALDKSMGTSYSMARQSNGYYIRTMYSD